MKSTKSVLALSLAVLLVLSLLCACGGGSKDSAYPSDTATQGDTTSESASGNGFGGESSYDSNSYETEAEYSEESEAQTEEVDGENLSADSKLIYRVYMDIETLDYDKSVEEVGRLCEEMGGYVEYSNVSGTRLGSSYLRSSSFTLRIPTDKLDKFESACGSIGNVFNNEREIENATAQYVDLSARLTAYETEQERLLELLEQAVSLDDIISLNARLSEVRYEIDSIKSSLRNIDSLVDYSTVNIYLSEVEEETTNYDVPRTFGEKLANKFSQSWESFKRFISNAVVYILGELPFLLLQIIIVLIPFAIVVVVIVLIVRKVRKRKGPRAKIEPPGVKDTDESGEEK